MVDIISVVQRHRIMSAVHSSSTRPELILRHILWRLGYRYRINDKRLPGSPDIVLPKYRTVIFVHGCFWHGHKGCKNYTIPKTNTDFWTAKVARNQERDQEVWRQLEAKGWFVIIVWECQLKKLVLDKTVDEVVKELGQNAETLRSEKAERKAARDCYLQERKKSKKREELLMKEISF